MKSIGCICNVDGGANPRKTNVSKQIYRPYEMSKILQEYGCQLVLYSPKYVNPHTKSTLGFVLNHNHFEPRIISQPIVNIEWYKNMSKNRHLNDDFIAYKKLVKKKDIDLYNPFEFLTSTCDKMSFYEYIKEHDRELQPFTEIYTHSDEQNELFINNYESVYIKPKNGVQGNGIIVIRFQGSQFLLTFYDQKKSTQYKFNSMPDLVKQVNFLVSSKTYIIQQGVISPKYNGRAYDLRVVVVNDGDAWRCIDKVRLGSDNGDISNVAQGGKIVNPINDIVDIHDLYSENIIEKINQKAIKLAKYFDLKYNNMLVEIGLDFIVDINENIYLLEVNSKPGTAVPDGFNNFFKLTKKEKQVYDIFIKPHAKAISKFLYGKL